MDINARVEDEGAVSLCKDYQAGERLHSQLVFVSSSRWHTMSINSRRVVDDNLS